MSCIFRIFALCACNVTILGLCCYGHGQDSPRSPDSARADALARLRAANSLQMMALAMLNYEAEYNQFPPIDGSSDAKVPKLAGFSWRAYLLPRMDTDTNPIREGQVYQSILAGKYPLGEKVKESESWNRPGLKSIPLQPFLSPKENKDREAWLTYYRVFVGNGAAFEAKQRLTSKDFPDGSMNTILIVEAGESVPWPKPEELTYDPAKPLPKLGGLFPDGFYAAFADGAVRFIRNGTDERLIRAMITRNGGEKIATLPPKVNTRALRKAAGLK